MYTYSEEHNNYLKKKKQEKIIVKIFQFLIIILFLILWEFFAHFNLINTFLLSSPSKVINTLYSLIING